VRACGCASAAGKVLGTARCNEHGADRRRLFPALGQLPDWRQGAGRLRRLVPRLLGAAPSWSSVMRRGHWIVTRPWQSWAFNRLEEVAVAIRTAELSSHSFSLSSFRAALGRAHGPPVYRAFDDGRAVKPKQLCPRSAQAPAVRKPRKRGARSTLAHAQNLANDGAFGSRRQAVHEKDSVGIAVLADCSSDPPLVRQIKQPAGLLMLVQKRPRRILYGRGREVEEGRNHSDETSRAGPACRTARSGHNGQRGDVLYGARRSRPPKLSGIVAQSNPHPGAPR
jgi:hypothetical protein